MTFIVAYSNTEEVKNFLFPTLIQASQSINLEKQAVHGNGFKTQLGEFNINNFKDLPLNHNAQYIKIEEGGLRVVKSLVVDI